MKRSKHSLSHYKLLTCNQGQFVPVGCTEVLPGDSIQHSLSALVRVAPLQRPVMHPVHVRIHHFFVPHRIVWDDWENFITGGPDNDDQSVFPTITLPDNASGGVEAGSLADYLGIPLGSNSDNSGYEVSALPFRAYALVYNEFLRDQDLISPLTIDKTSGPDTTTSTDLQNICWGKDYFTSARPWPQKGPEIFLPLGETAPVVGDGTPLRARAGSNAIGNVTSSSIGGGGLIAINRGANTGSIYVADDGSSSGLIADLAQATGVSINDVRRYFALQRYAEHRAIYGSRYTEYLRYLGVRSSDARLQRPEYLGGGKQTIQFSEVLQTAEGTEGTVGEMFGHGIGALRSNKYRRFFEEHGYILSFISVKPTTMYVQGIPRTFNRRTREDFWQKELQHIGQQEILNKEIYAAHADPDDPFGWQDRYDEYRRMFSSVAGEFRTSVADDWHMARIFSAPPVLNGDFVRSNPTDRIYSAGEELAHQLYIMASHSMQARRLIAKSGNSFVK